MSPLLFLPYATLEKKSLENNHTATMAMGQNSYCGVLSKWEFFVEMRAAFLASILPQVMKEGESKKGSSHFDEKLSIW